MKATIFSERNSEGAWVLSSIPSGSRVTRQYYGYTLREATRLYRQALKENASK